MEKIEILPAWMKIFKGFSKIKKKDIVHFTRQLATMIKAGLPLTTALSILKYQSNLSMAKVVDEILRNIEGGSSFFNALNKQINIHRFLEIFTRAPVTCFLFIFLRSMPRQHYYLHFRINFFYLPENFNPIHAW